MSGILAVLDNVEFGCLVSRVANLHPNGGEWTLSRALGEAASALEAIEAKKTQAGKDFGELVRERRRQRGLPLPVADKVLPFRPMSSARSVASAHEDAEQRPEARLADAWLRLAEAEERLAPSRELGKLEAAYMHEVRQHTASGVEHPQGQLHELT